MAYAGSRASASLPTPSQRLSLHDEIVVRLRDMILEGVLKPGEAIPELKMCADLHISRTPLREALKVLAAEDYVTLLPNRGSVVREIIPEEIEEVFQIMQALDGLIGHLVAERVTDDEIVELQAMHHQLVRFNNASEKHAYFDVNQAIHCRIAELSGNRTLASGYSAYADKIRRARYLANLSSARWSESVEEHERFMQALADRNGAELSRLLQDHIRLTSIAVVDALKQIPIIKPLPRRKRS